MPENRNQKEDAIQILIDHQCPQCGAPATLKETDRLFECGFCRVRSFLSQPNYFRYVLPASGKSVQNDLIYFPYWRYRGMMYSCLAQDIHHQFVDFSYQAFPCDAFPSSVGLRSQALKLAFATPDMPGHFIRPKDHGAGIGTILETRYNKTLPKPIFYQAYVGDVTSLIYAPFYMKQKLIDAVLDRPVGLNQPEGFDPTGFSGGKTNAGINFLPTLCPDCGRDLEGERSSLALNCLNCQTVWHSAGMRLAKLKFGYIRDSLPTALYLPFWRIQASVSGIGLSTYADLVRLANLPKVIQPGWEDIEFRFWCPAFKIQPRTLMMLSRNLTLVQPQNALISEHQPGKRYPVTLPVNEAVKGIKISLAGFLKPVEDYQPLLKDIEIRPIRYLLVYIPFEAGHHEWLNSTLHMAIQKNQLALSGNL